MKERIDTANRFNIESKLNYAVVFRGTFNDLTLFQRDLTNLLKKHVNIQTVYVKTSTLLLWINEARGGETDE